MFKFIKDYVKYIFGPQQYEIILATSTNENIKKLLRVNARIRFFVFPISLAIWSVGFIAEVLITLLSYISRISHYTFESVNDSLWIPTTWFNLKEEDLKNEVTRLEETLEEA